MPTSCIPYTEQVLSVPVFSVPYLPGRHVLSGQDCTIHQPALLKSCQMDYGGYGKHLFICLLSETFYRVWNI